MRVRAGLACTLALVALLLSSGAQATSLQCGCGGGSGTGDVTDIGDCSTGACFTDASGAGTQLYFKNATSGSITFNTVTGALGTKTISLPAENGTVCTTGSVCSGYQAAGTYATNSFTTWTTSSGTSPVADSASDTMTFTGTAPIVATGSSAADSITLSCTSADTSTTGCITSTDWNTFNGKAPASAKYITQTTDGTLSAEQSLGALTTGLLLNTVTTGTGVLTAYGGTGTCGASTWFTALDASGAKTCTQPAFSDISGSVTDAQVPDTITLTNITQIGTRAHSSLSGLSADDHTQYVMLAGRSGGQTLNGSTLTGESLILQPNAADHTTGTITLNAPSVILDSSYTNTTASNDLLAFSATATLSGGGSPTLNGYNFHPALTLSSGTNGVNGLDFGGTINVTSTVPLIRGLLFSPTIDYSNTSDPFPVYQANAAVCAPTFTSSTANGPLYQDCFVDGTTITYSGASDVDASSATGNPWAPFSLLISGTTQTSGAGDLTIHQIGGIKYQGGFDTGNAASVLTVDDLNVISAVAPACVSNNCGPGSVAFGGVSLVNGDFTTALGTSESIGTAYGLRLQSWDKATTNITVFSDATGATMRHAGPARFGATGAPSTGYTLDSAGALQVGTVGGLIADVSSGTTAFISASDSVDVTAGVLAGLNFTPTTTLGPGGAFAGGSVTGLNFAPTIAESIAFPIVSAVTMGGTMTSTANAAQSAFILTNTATFTSATANIPPVSTLYGVGDTPNVTSTAASGSATVGNTIGLQHAPVITQNSSGGATGTLTVTSDIGLNMVGSYVQTAGTLAVTNRIGLKYKTPTDASSVLANNIAVDVDATTKGSTERTALRSAIASNAAAYFLHDTGGAQMSTVGKFTTYNNVAADSSHSGMPLTVAKVTNTAQGANVAAADLLASGSVAAGRYRACAYVAITRAGTTSTMPNANLICTDPTDSVAKTMVLTASSTANTTGTAASACGICDAKASTAIQYSTTNWASTGGTSMQYKYYITLEVM